MQPDPPPIQTVTEYRKAMLEINGLMDALPDTPEGDCLGLLVGLVEEWEAKRYPIDPPTP